MYIDRYIIASQYANNTRQLVKINIFRVYLAIAFAIIYYKYKYRYIIVNNKIVVLQNKYYFCMGIYLL